MRQHSFLTPPFTPTQTHVSLSLSEPFVTDCTVCLGAWWCQVDTFGTKMDIRSWFESIPIITRHWFGLTVAATLLGKIGILKIHWCYLGSEFITKFHIWRPVTAVLYYPLSPQNGFHFLTMLYFMYQYSTRLETGMFNGRTADYLYCLTFNWIVSCLLCYSMGIYFLMDPLVMSVLYIWCQVNKDTTINFWFGTQFKAYLLPWVLLVFNMIITGRFLSDLAGIIIGHLYYFLVFIYPDEYGGDRWIQTPNLFYAYFPLSRGSGSSSRFSGDARSTARSGASSRTSDSSRTSGPLPHSWGSGRTLGGN